MVHVKAGNYVRHPNPYLYLPANRSDNSSRSRNKVYVKTLHVSAAGAVHNQDDLVLAQTNGLTPPHFSLIEADHADRNRLLLLVGTVPHCSSRPSKRSVYTGTCNATALSTRSPGVRLLETRFATSQAAPHRAALVVVRSCLQRNSLSGSLSHLQHLRSSLKAHSTLDIGRGLIITDTDRLIDHLTNHRYPFTPISHLSFVPSSASLVHSISSECHFPLWLHKTSFLFTSLTSSRRTA